MNLIFGLNLNNTKLKTDTINLDEKLRGFEKDFFNREERSRYEEIIPSFKIFLTGYGSYKHFTCKAQITVFGKNAYKYPELATGELDEVYDNWQYPIIDVELGYKWAKGFSIAGGLNNAGNFRSNPVSNSKVPDNLKTTWFNNVSNYNLFQYSRRVQTFGVGGILGYIKIAYQIGQK